MDATGYEGEAMDWKQLLAYITGTVDQELLLRNEYLVAENRALITASATPFCFCAMQKHLTIERIRRSRT